EGGKMYPRIKPLAVLLPILFSLPIHAQQLASLDPIVVTATRQPMKASELLSDVTVIEREEIEKAAQSTIGELLSTQPGIEMSANGSPGAVSNIYMRGSNSSHVLVLIDGMRVGSATLGSISWSRVPVSQVDRIEILRGPASSLYGSDAIGGVVQIFTKRGSGPMQFTAEAGAGSYDTYSTSAGVSGETDGWRYSLYAGTQQSAGFNSIRNTKNASYNPDRDGYKNDNATGSLSYSPAKGHEIGGSFFYSDGDNRYDSSPKARDYRNSLIVSSYDLYSRNAITSNWTSNLKVGRTTDNSINRTNDVRTSLFATDQDQLLWQNDVKTGVGTFLLGLERLEQKISGTSNYRIKDRSIDSAMAGWNGVFGSHRLQASLRHDQNSQFGDKNTGSVAYGFQFTPAWRANVGYGTAFKAPSFNDLYFPLTFGYQGNPNLLPETSRNREASVHYEAAGHHASVTWFLNRVENLISWSGVTTPVNIGNARLEGVTLAYEGHVGSYDVQANYNYLDPRDVATGHQLARRASNFGTVALGRRLGDWEWRTEAQASDRRFDTDANTRKLSGYTIVNVYGAYHFSKDWSAFARVNNLFDREYELAGDYATPRTNVFVGVRYQPK
ncbi:MAG TPA: TonB-dependent receptor, partial [Rhodocyclaceae bacterium]|nr:TonB-dependent receptor [Rhodocyclaceae bacterium]